MTNDDFKAPGDLSVYDKLIEEARPSGTHKTKKVGGPHGSAEYVRRRKQLSFIQAFGSFDFDPAYDYKAERRRKRR